MNRRDFLRNVGVGGALCGMGMTPGYAMEDGYSGKLLVTVQADGAWDVSSFCDPKMNVAGEPEINWWARSDETRVAGNVAYAPFAENVAFFEKYADRMLVINGVDTQTNAHAAGVLHSWSGRNVDGYPSLPALLTSSSAATLPMAYLTFGGFSVTSNLIRSTVMSDVTALADILRPNVPNWDPNRTIRSSGAVDLVSQAQARRRTRLLADSSLLPLQRYNLESYNSAYANKEAMSQFADLLPNVNDLEQPETIQKNQIYLRQQAQIAVLAFKGGVAAAADLSISGFDTHGDHDRDHEPLMGALTRGIDFLWDYAEQHGIADRLVVVVGSDFARTPFYNSYDGKDHWPVSSYLVMEKNVPWSNRVVGLTDEAQNAFKINPFTLERDDSQGTIIYPKHVHKALRRYLALDNTPADANFQLTDVEDFEFFGK